MAAGLVVADTDLIIDFLRGRDPGAGAVRRWLRSDRLRVTSVTAFELRVGTDFLDRARDLRSLLAGRTLPMDLLAGLLAGDIYSRLRADGLDIGVKDALQSGVCRRFELPIATRNLRHLERVEGLALAPLEE